MFGISRDIVLPMSDWPRNRVAKCGNKDVTVLN